MAPIKLEIYREAIKSDAKFFVLEKEFSGDWRWRMKAQNGKIVADSGEGYENLKDMLKTVRKFIVRGDVDMEAQLAWALNKRGYNQEGKKL